VKDQRAEQTDDEDDDELGLDDGKSLILKRKSFQRHGYNLSHMMGTFLRERFTFSRLDGIRNAYSRAFFDHADDIHKSINHESVRATCAVRNLLVHREGHCDDEYVRHSRSLPKLLPKLELGEKIQIDGELITRLLPDAFAACVDVMRRVDLWIINHDKKEGLSPPEYSI
jgi:Rad3-related DNA helicase